MNIHFQFKGNAICWGNVKSVEKFFFEAYCKGAVSIAGADCGGIGAGGGAKHRLFPVLKTQSRSKYFGGNSA